MLIRGVFIMLIAGVCALAGCGPEGPRDQGGAKADPVALLRVLPTPNELREVHPAHTADAAEALTAVLGAPDPAAAEQLEGAGVETIGVRNWRGVDGGTMAATVAVWPTRAVASNFALQVAQRHLAEGGVAWTPDDVPGSQGVRQRGSGGQRVLTRTVGPNALIVTADGPIPDATVATAMERLFIVQEARNG